MVCRVRGRVWKSGEVEICFWCQVGLGIFGTTDRCGGFGAVEIYTQCE